MSVFFSLPVSFLLSFLKLDCLFCPKPSLVVIVNVFFDFRATYSRDKNEDIPPHTIFCIDKQIGMHCILSHVPMFLSSVLSTEMLQERLMSAMFSRTPGNEVLLP